jgi:hypothetical protein
MITCIHPFTMGGYQYISINIVGDIECWVVGGGTTQKFGTEAAVDAATNLYFIVGGRSILHE